MTHVENAAYAHIIAAEALMDNSEISGKKYFISDDAPVYLWEWINNFLKNSGFPPVTKKISYRKAYTAGFLLEQIYKFFPLKGEPPMTRFVAAQFAHSHYFNISAAKKDFAYTPAVDSDAAYRETVEWIREVHKTSSQRPKED
jgi:nucleoside-diphosphate-sugar epimerase